MPPRGRRKRDATDSPASQEPSELSSESPETGPPFFDTTFSTHRVSPLYVGPKPLDRDRCRALATQLRDLLVGDVVRGVEVGLDGNDGVMPRAGVLEAVELGWVAIGSILSVDPRTMDNITGEDGRPVSRDLGSGTGAVPDPSWDNGATSPRLGSVSSRQALHLSICYESALCTALLLPPLDEEEDAQLRTDLVGDPNKVNMFQQAPPRGRHNNKPAKPGHFRNLPLLLLRMPSPLRSVISDFLSNTFDCRISPLRLGTQTLLTNLERWVDISSLARGPAATKDVILTLGFSLPAQSTPHSGADDPRTAGLGLKAIDVILSTSELHKIRDMGTRAELSDKSRSLKRKALWEEDASKRRRVDGHMLEEGWEWRYKMGGETDPSGSGASYPFTNALGIYFDEHLALNLFDPCTMVTKVGCGGFVMSESRLKLFSPADKDSGGHARRSVLTRHTQAVVECLSDLLNRAMARP